MKKLFLILLIFPISIYSQEVQQNVQVNIKERGQTYSDVVAARAAESAAMTDSSKDIKASLICLCTHVYFCLPLLTPVYLRLPHIT